MSAQPDNAGMTEQPVRPRDTLVLPRMSAEVSTPTRERLVHSLYEAAELEHNLMCTYLYAAFSLRDGPAEGLSQREAEAVARWRRTIMSVALEEMGHLAAVWNITSALGGSPRFGRGNFPLDPGALPAGVVVKLAPFSEEVVQHFIFLERPDGCAEPDGVGFEPELTFRRGVDQARLTPMAHRLRDRRRVLRDARAAPPRFRRARRRGRGVLRRPGAAALAGRARARRAPSRSSARRPRMRRFVRSSSKAKARPPIPRARTFSASSGFARSSPR